MAAHIEELVAAYRAKLLAEAAGTQGDECKQNEGLGSNKPLQPGEMINADLQKESQADGRKVVQRILTHSASKVEESIKNKKPLGLTADKGIAKGSVASQIHLPVDGYGSSSESEDSDGAEHNARSCEGKGQPNAPIEAAANKTGKRRKRYQPPGYSKAQSKRGWKLLRRMIDERFVPTGLTFEKLPKDLKKKELADFTQSFPNFFPNKQALNRYVSRHMTRKKSYAKLTAAEKRAHIEKAVLSKKRRKAGPEAQGDGLSPLTSAAKKPQPQAGVKKRRLVKLLEEAGENQSAVDGAAVDVDTQLFETNDPPAALQELLPNVQPHGHPRVKPAEGLKNLPSEVGSITNNKPGAHKGTELPAYVPSGTSPKASVSCFKCGEPGHRATDCPADPKSRTDAPPSTADRRDGKKTPSLKDLGSGKKKGEFGDDSSSLPLIATRAGPRPVEAMLKEESKCDLLEGSHVQSTEQTIPEALADAKPAAGCPSVAPDSSLQPGASSSTSPPGNDDNTASLKGPAKDNPKDTANPPPPSLAQTREPRTTAGQTSMFRDFQIAGNGPTGAVAPGKDGKATGKPKVPGSSAKKLPRAVHLFLPRKGKPKVYVGTGHVFYSRADQTVGGKPLGEGRVGVILDETDDLVAALEVPEGFAASVARSKKRQFAAEKIN